MSKDDNWSWWVGNDDERYHTECDSREEAVRIAKEEYDGGYIVEAIQASNIQIADYFDVDDFFETANERADDDHGDPEGSAPIFELSLEQERDLQERVRAAIKGWQEAQGLTFRGWRFTAQRNEEYIPAAAAEKV